MKVTSMSLDEMETQVVQAIKCKTTISEDDNL